MIATAERRLPESSAARAVRQAQMRRLRARIAVLEREAPHCYRALPHVADFHESRKAVTIIDGSNQSGKSLAAEMEMVKRATGRSDKSPKRDGRALVVGLDEQHLADPLWRKLSREGEFKLIHDEHTGKPRAVRPDPKNPRQLDPYDLAYREKWFDAPPLLPPRYIKNISWADAGIRAPRVVELTTGWRITFRSSKGALPQGIQVHFCLFDEELDHSDAWLNELVPRMIKEGGKLIWAATPQTGGIALWELKEKADGGDPHVDRFTLLIDDNPFILPEQKQFFFDMLTDEQERAVRYFGEYAIMGRFVYSTYNPTGIHGCDPFEIPPNWCRYCVLDPGTQALSTLFAAVDPDQTHLWVYDGFKMEKAEQGAWAWEVKRRSLGRPFHAFIIDQQAGKQHPFGDSLNVAQQYMAAMQYVGIEPLTRGPERQLAGFYAGTNDTESRELALRALMAIRGDGPHPNTPVLQVVRGAIRDLDKQIKNARTKEGSLDKRDKQYDEGLLECLEYLAAHGPKYHAPPTPPAAASDGPIAELRKWKRHLDRRRNHEHRGQQFASTIAIG